MKMLFIASGSIGDVIISTGILGHLMDEYPEADFTIAVGPAAKQLFEACPRISRVIPIIKQPWNRHWLLLWREIYTTKWDLIVDLRGSIISYLVNTRHQLIFRKPDRTLSKAMQLATLLKLPSPPPPRLWASDEKRAEAASLLPKDKRIIVIAPKTASAAKDWPLERFAELIQRLYRDDVVFAILASASQTASIQSLLRSVPSEYICDLSGKTDLLTAYAIMESAKLFIGNDSGLLHMAAAAHIPCVGIYGPTNDKTYAPTSEKIHIVTAITFLPGEEEKRDNKYMQMIDVDKVEAAVRSLHAF